MLQLPSSPHGHAIQKSAEQLELEIDETIRMLEVETSLGHLPTPMPHASSYVNLDQLDNTINEHSKGGNRKYAIDAVLNQSVKVPGALKAIDECVQILLNKWQDVNVLKTRTAADVFKLLQQKIYKNTAWLSMTKFYYDQPSKICARILNIVKKINAMKLLLSHQRLVHLPSSSKEWSALLAGLRKGSQKGSQKDGHSLAKIQEQKQNDDDDDDSDDFGGGGGDDIDTNAFNTPISTHSMETENAFNTPNSVLEMDQDSNVINATNAMMDVLLRHRKRFNRTDIYKANINGGSQGGKFFNTMLTSMRSSKSTKTGLTDKTVLTDDTSIITDGGSDMQMAVLDRSMSDALPGTKRNRKRIICDGCGHRIDDIWDGEAAKHIITYECKFLGSELVYLHDRHCENLRKYKESIRKYVSESLMKAKDKNKKAKNMKSYVIHLLNNHELLININGGLLPRPGILLENEQNKLLSFIPMRKSTKQIEMPESPLSYSNDRSSVDLDHQEAQNDKLNLLEIAKQRDMAVRLLTRGEIVNQAFQKYNSAMYYENDLDDDDDMIGQHGGLFDDIPKVIQYADSHIFGEPLFIFVVQQLLSKQSNALWRLLAYISMQLPTVHAIMLLDQYKADLGKVKKMHNLELVCTSIIQTSAYPIGTALHLSGFMSSLADQDLSREEDFRDVATRYINIAEDLVEYVESDHLLALLLETPTDINQQNVFDIAIQFGLDDFFDNNRVNRCMTHMHHKFDFLNPNVTFITKDFDMYHILKYMVQSPSKFYYCPIGKFWVATMTYVAYVYLVSAICYQQRYLYLPVENIEWVMWSANVGYISYEVTEMMFKGFEYFNEISNLFDTLISLNWFFLAFLRFLCPIIIPDDMINADKCTADSCSDNHVNSRNLPLNTAYMLFFGLQMVILYLRFASILSRSRTLGPYVRMIQTMIVDTFFFGIIVVIMCVGFTFAMIFVIADDTTHDCGAELDLNSAASVGLYVFQTLLGQQEWDHLQSNECFGPNRSRIVQFFMVVLSILGTVLLLNLLIAMMASTYENKRQSTSKDVQFSRTEETYELAHRNALISAPFNILVFILSIFFEFVSLMVVVFTCGHYIFDITALVPVHVNYRKFHDKKHFKQGRNKVQKICDRVKRCCGSFIDKVKDIAPEGEEDTFLRDIYFNYGMSGRKYCRYCRVYIKQSADIAEYFDLFRNYRLDRDDVDLMKRLMQGTFVGICPNCYRPYKIAEENHTDRLHRWEIQLEIISYYVFRLLVHIPMIFAMLLPAVFGFVISYFQRIANESTRISSASDEASIFAVQSDEQYRNLVQHVIDNELSKDVDLLGTKIEALDQRFQQIANQQASYASNIETITSLLLKINQKLDISDAMMQEDNDIISQVPLQFDVTSVLSEAD